MGNHINAKNIYDLFNARTALPREVMEHLNTCEHCRRVLGAFLSADAAHNPDEEFDDDRAAGTLKGVLEGFFDKVSAVGAGSVADLKKFLSAPDFSSFVPALRFGTLAAAAAKDTPKQHTAEGRLPNDSAYKVLYGPFETILEIEAFKPEPPRVLYYRTSDDGSSFEQYSASWTSAKSDRWTVKLSPDHPAIVALPELNCVILAQSYRSLAGRRG
jgi:hypothetical protein